MAKTLAQIMEDMAAQGITVSTSSPKSEVTALTREAATDAKNYWCHVCDSAADHTDEEHHMPARLLRECTVCGETVTMSNATEAWEKRHLASKH